MEMTRQQVNVLLNSMTEDQLRTAMRVVAYLNLPLAATAVNQGIGTYPIET